MAKKALLVGDMIKDFMEDYGALYCGDRCRVIIPFVQKKIEEFRKNKDLVIFIIDTHTPDDPEFKYFGRHCVKGTKGTELVSGLEVKKGECVVEKNTYDAYFNTDLGKVLEDNNIKEAHFVGVCTSICVMETVGSLAKRGYTTIVYKDGVADLDDESHRFALKRMKKIYGTEII